VRVAAQTGIFGPGSSGRDGARGGGPSDRCEMLVSLISRPKYRVAAVPASHATAIHSPSPLGHPN